MAESEHTDVKQAVAAYEEADREYHRLEEKLLEGYFIQEMLMAPAQAHVIWAGLIRELKDALEERNVKLKEAQNLLRSKVALAPTKWRGPKGAPTELSAGSFKVSSVTHRGFDHKSLFTLCQARGVYERLMELKKLDENGKEKKLVEQLYDIDYDGVMKWLETNKMEDVIEGAYDESEKTPQVKGPKPLAFLGEKKDR